MGYHMKFLRLLAIPFIFFASSIVLGQTNQGTVPAYSIPVGKGAGVVGWGSAAPGTAGQVLTSNGAAANPTFQAFGASGVTFTDTLFLLKNNADATKLFRFDASGITAATTRVLTVPNANTTLVGTDFAQTLTNKTISGASNTLSNIPLSTLTGATGTGTILRANGTNWVATTATYPTTTTINQILYSSAGNVITGLATVNGGLLNAGATGIPAITVTPILGVAGTSKGTLRFSGNTSGVVTLQPAAAAGTYSLTLPPNDGDAGQFLQTDGSGVSTWAATTNMQTGFTGAVSTGNIAASSTNYLVTTGYIASEGGSRMPVPIAMTITGMALSADNIPGGVQTYTYTLMVNGGATAMTCTTTGAANTCSTSANPQILTVGSTYAIRIVTSATATVAQHKWGISYTTP
jgi:hypothetical protein